MDRDAFDSVLLWYQKTLPPSPSDCLRDLKIKDLLFTIFSIGGGQFDYITMLLALCKDDRPTMGLIKAISLLTGRNILPNQRCDSNSGYSGSHYPDEKNCQQLLPMETVYNTLIVCLKNYMVGISVLSPLNRVIFYYYCFFFIFRVCTEKKLHRV